ncbi:AAA family ATPase [Nocardia inohanensis]|uniref:AAA family ATPase n=1 Tax=Nocardia inohanensis TaxID=209246 RepID=UPI00083728AD|nr:AAA family ATPase [Nocardia inohanensis]
MLRILVLGPLRAELNGESVRLPDHRQRVCALLAWLAVHPGPHQRSRLAAEFWPDVPEANARASLRSAVWALRGALGAAADCLEAGRDTVQLGGEVRVDLVEFNRLAAAGDAMAAVRLCRGEVLSGWYEDWLPQVRADHARRLGKVLSLAAAHAETSGDLEAAVGWARQRAELDRTDEIAWRELIRLLAAHGDADGALAAYATLRQMLDAELGLAPAAETIALMRRIRPAEPAGAGPDPTSPLHSSGPVEKPPRSRNCPSPNGIGSDLVIMISGAGGVGESALTEEMLDLAARRGARIVCGAGSGAGGAPFGVWTRLLTDLLTGADPLPPEVTWTTDLARLVPALAPRVARLDPESDRIRLFEAVVRLLTALSARRPLVLVLEDLHLADPASLELLGYVCRRTRRVQSSLPWREPMNRNSSGSAEVNRSISSPPVHE